MKSTVYRVQVRTFHVALGVLGIPVPEPGRGLATPGDHVLTTFRALPGRRDGRGQALRDAVAARVRADRRGGRVG